jgi:predicted RNA-binding protein with TRAM domain
MPFERRRFSRKFMNIPKPVKVGEEYDVEITETGSKGDGIARIKNFVVFVPGSNKGEKRHIRIKEVRNKFAIGEITESQVKESEGSA